MNPTAGNSLLCRKIYEKAFIASFESRFLFFRFNSLPETPKTDEQNFHKIKGTAS